MNEQDNILNEFDKLLQTFNTISGELQLDLIKKFESKLNQLKESIQTKRSVCKSNEIHQKIYRKSKSLENLTKIGKNSDQSPDITSNFVLNIRKSERILNRRTQLFGSKYTETDKQQINNGFKTTEEYQSLVEEQSVLNPNEDSEYSPTEVIRNVSKDDHKVVTRRKWRRTKDINDLKCKFCGKIWRSLSHLEIHLRTHTGEKIFECQQCGQRFAQMAGLQVHQRRHNNDRRFGCDICQKAFYTKIDLTRHKSSHKLIKRITHCCEKCGKGFSESRKLKNHIRYVHEKKDSVVCEICGHITHGQHLLYAHKRVKHGDMTKYGCPVCKAVIGSRSAFVVHLRAHAEVKPCACDICGKKFRSKSQVARHKLAHMEGRHECDICSKKFKTPHHLRRHQVIHSGNKPFECHLCQYKCNVKSNVVKHVKSVHGIVDFSFPKQITQIEEPIENNALEKGSIVTQQVLNDISVTKGEKITLNELKRLNEKKLREKEINLKEMTQNIRNRKQLFKQKVVKQRKDILIDAITSTINDYNSSNTGADNVIIESSVNISVGINTGSNLTPVIIQNPSHIYEIKADPTQESSKVDNCLPNSSEQQLKDVITLHFTN